MRGKTSEFAKSRTSNRLGLTNLLFKILSASLTILTECANSCLANLAFPVTGVLSYVSLTSSFSSAEIISAGKLSEPFQTSGEGHTCNAIVFPLEVR